MNRDEETNFFRTEALDDEACLIKGTVLDDGRKIYRDKTCSAYGGVTVLESKGDAWLCSLETAQQDGWEKANDCL